MIAITDVVFAFDFKSLTAGGLLRDGGPYELHATPGAGAAAPTAQANGYSFDGGDYFELSGGSQARFYSVAPTGAYTWLAVYTTSQADQALFGCYTLAGGFNYGLVLRAYPGVAARTLFVYSMQGTAALPRIDCVTGTRTTDAMTVIHTVDTTPRASLYGVRHATAWAVGGFGTTQYDAARVPRIGSDATFGIPSLVGTFRYLALIRRAMSGAELDLYGRLLSEGIKPWSASS